MIREINIDKIKLKMVKELNQSKKQSVKSADEKQPKKGLKSDHIKSKSNKLKKDKTLKLKPNDKFKKKLTKRFNKLRLNTDYLESRGVVYIGHLPKGFEEDELRKFFE